MRFDNVHAVGARITCWPIWPAGRGLITTLGWNTKHIVQTRVFENVRAVQARSPFWRVVGKTREQANEPEGKTSENRRERCLPAANN